VTFFNYFPSKRDAVDFLMILQMFRFQAEIHQQGLRGVEAIDHIFARAGDDLVEAPERLRRIYGEFCARPHGALEPPTLAERMQIVPDLDPSFEMVGLGQLFVRLVAEAKEDGVELVGSSYEISHFLGGLLHGAALIGRSKDDSDWKQLFRRHARRALGLLGAEGWCDPRPPRIPARYRAGDQGGGGGSQQRRRKTSRKRRKG
jgi:AcrR family transcriptional regulator